MRLPVILVQQPPAGGSSLAEDLVGNLIGRPGLDLTLVNRFESIRSDSTDQITLDSITGDVAVLDWESAEQSHRILATLGFEGTRWPHRFDAFQPTNGSPVRRRIFLFDLRKVSGAAELIDALGSLRESLSVKTVPILGVAAPSRSAAPVAITKPRTIPHPGLEPFPQPTSETVDAGSDDALDALIDRLDDLDV